MNITVALTTLLFILPVELPDKTLLATLVLSTRYRPLPVLLGVAAAFAVQRGGGQEESDEGVADRRNRGTLSIATVSFGVLFAAEWGDASQLATAALTARYADPVSVFVGSFVALVTVAALAVLLGGWITQRVPLRLIQRIGGLLFLVFALIALYETIHA